MRPRGEELMERQDLESRMEQDELVGEEERLTPLDKYIAALDRAARYATALAFTLRGVRTEEALLQKDLLDKWVELTGKLDQERVVILRGQQQYQRWAIRRYAEKRERATYKLPPYQR